MDDSRLLALIDRHLEEPEASSQELLEVLRHSAEARQGFVRRMLFEAELTAACGVQGPIAVSRSAGLIRACALAATLVAVAGLSWWIARRTAPIVTMTPVVIARDGTEVATSGTPYLLRSGVMLVDGDTGPVSDGAILEVVGRQPAEVVMADGSTAIFQPGSQCVLHRDDGACRQTVELRRGTGSFSVIPADRVFLVQTKAASATVLGTDFTVTYQGSRSRAMTVAVTQGRVRVDYEGGSSLLQAGDRQVFSKGDLTRRIVCGRLVEVTDDGELVVATGQGRLHRSYNLADDSAIWRAEHRLDLGDLSPGMLVDLEFEGQQVRSVRIRRPVLKVTVLAVDVTTRQLTVVEIEGHSPPEVYPLAEQAVLRCGNQILGLDDLSLGMTAKISLTNDWSNIELLEIPQPSVE